MCRSSFLTNKGAPNRIMCWIRPTISKVERTDPLTLRLRFEQPAV